MPLYSIPTDGSNFNAHLQQQWLLTNGMGAYAAGTVVGCNTSRYHGLLCAALMPPVGRAMLLNRLGEVVGCNGDLFDLSVNQFGPEFHPHGDRNLRTVTLTGHGEVRWEYEVDGIRIVKELLLLWGENTAAIRYTVTPGKHRRVELQVLPFVSLTDFHAVRRAWAPLDVQPIDVAVQGNPTSTSRPTQSLRAAPSAGGALPVGPTTAEPGAATTQATPDRAAGVVGVCVTDRAGQGPGGLPVRVCLSATAIGGEAHFVPKADWWFNHTYRQDAERGQDSSEDLYTPGRFECAATGGKPVTLTLIVSANPVAKIDWDAERARHVAATPFASGKPFTPVIERLTAAADDFIVARQAPDGTPSRTIIAGYPWFFDWGRDTMIALPGLLLTTRRFAEAGQVLGMFAAYVSQGMIPNRFNDYTNEPEYNTVDASLWFIHACFEYRRLSGDATLFDAKLRPACQQIVDGYQGGTRFNIHADPADGLIVQGDADTQLTWMDAKYNGVAFTPRQGKPVEINALWYHALRLMGDTARADRMGESFRRAFWISPERGLADVVQGGAEAETGEYPHRDRSVRPNQIFAASLPNSPLDALQRSAVVEVVRRQLLTPFGLRTLAEEEPNYHGRYAGPQSQRDAAYHNGTVWPWLMGPFLEAYLLAKGRSAAAIQQAKAWLSPLIAGMASIGCIGQIGEIYEGDEPHRPVGAFAQAWSVAEILRLAAELDM